MIYHGDLFDVLPTLEAESIDACVTDPPYGIGFMGRTWDTFKPGEAEKRIKSCEPIQSDNPNLKGRKRAPASSPSAVEYDRSLRGQHEFQAWSEAWAREVFRVLKPGAYLVVCGAPRSYHRMASGLEDAGFEIRDCFLYWGFGQGFPKSLQVSNDARFCQCQKERRGHVGASVQSVRPTLDANEPLSSDSKQDVFRSLLEEDSRGAEAVDESRAECDLRGVFQSISPSAESSQALAETNLLAPLQWDAQSQDADSVLWEHEGPETERPKIRRGQSSMEGRRDVLSEARQLQADQVRQMSGDVPADGPEGRVHHGASPDNGELGRQSTGQVGGRASWRPQSAEQQPDQSGTVAIESGAQAPRRWPTCDRCGKSVVPAGLGTALKPAYEPIVLARKPFRGTLAANLEKHGTGAINIDACRLPTGESWSYNADRNGTTFHGEQGERIRQTAEKKGAATVDSNPLGRWPANVLLDEIAAEMLDEQSGELSTHPGVIGDGGTSRGVFGVTGTAGTIINADRGGASRFFYVAKPSREERNQGIYEGRSTHPTVKPVELMRWLVKLVTPPNGKVLDPFCGSGSTGMACAYEFREFIGIEREAEYVEIAKRRIAACAPLFTETGA